nr:MAG TPA: hypothetical protein [Caudoviricetes sp.]
MTNKIKSGIIKMFSKREQNLNRAPTATSVGERGSLWLPL